MLSSTALSRFVMRRHALFHCFVTHPLALQLDVRLACSTVPQDMCTYACMHPSHVHAMRRYARTPEPSHRHEHTRPPWSPISAANPTRPVRSGPHQISAATPEKSAHRGLTMGRLEEDAEAMGGTASALIAASHLSEQAAIDAANTRLASAADAIAAESAVRPLELP